MAGVLSAYTEACVPQSAVLRVTQESQALVLSRPEQFGPD